MTPIVSAGARRVCLRFTLVALLTGVAACDDAGSPGTHGGPFDNNVNDGGIAATQAGGAGGGAGKGGAGGKAPTAAGGKGGTSIVAGSGGSTTITGSGGAMTTTGSGGAGGKSGGTGSGGIPGGPDCTACEQQNCSADMQLWSQCMSGNDPNTGMPAVAMAGSKAGTSEKTLCQAVVDCVRATGCIQWSGQDSIQDCYCGMGVDPLDCLGDNGTNGPCKSQFEAAAEAMPNFSAGDTYGGIVADRSVDPTYALGAATNLIQICDYMYCAQSCLGLTLSGSGGTAQTGSGGSPASGSGGVVGTGGVSGAGSGGNTGAGGAGSTDVTYTQCATCEMTNCPPPDVLPCAMVTGTAQDGPSKGASRADLCQQVVDCVRSTKCSVMGDARPCYCGTASDAACLGGRGNGMCKSVIEAASESTDAGDVADRFSIADPTMPPPYAVGFATAVIGCGYFYDDCRDPCTNGDPAGSGSGSGGNPGTSSGGTTGSGGGTASGGVTGTGAATASSGGAPGSGGVIGSGGNVGSGGVVASAPCADLNQNATSDCTETSVTNSDFATSGSFWIVEYGMQASWLPGPGGDALGNAASGGLAVGNPVVADADGTTMGGVRQCIPVAGNTYQVLADVFIPTGQGEGSAGVALGFYPSGDCTGTPSGALMTPLAMNAGQWTLLQTSAPVPSGATSLAVRLIILKSFRSAAFQAKFDNILVKSQ